MRILYLSSQYPPLGRGGAEKAVSTLVEAMRDAGHQVSVVCLYSGAEERIDQHNGIRVHRLPIANLYWPWGCDERPGELNRIRWHWNDRWNREAAKRVGEILDAEKPDVVHTHNISGFSVSVWAEVKRRGIRLVHTMHDYYLLCIRSALYRDGATCRQQCATCRLTKSTARRASKMVDHLISVSQFVLDRHRENGYFLGVPASVVYNIHSGLEIAASTEAPSAVAALRFGFIGAIIEEKGIEALLEAATALGEGNWSLTLAGNGSPEYVQQLKQRYLNAKIEWVGFINPVDFFSRIDTLIVPSRWPDPLPYVVVEGLAAGKSLICARSGGIPELAGLGESVALYDPTNDRGLTDSLRSAIAHPDAWKRGSSQNLKMNEAFSAETVVIAHIDTYMCAHSRP